MKLPIVLTTVTPLSKFLALFLFILFPLVGFKLGMEYQRLMNQSQDYHVENQVFPSQEECQRITGKICVDQMCDYIPKGKTFEETCGIDFKKGWVPSTENFISPIPADEMSNWKTYRHEELGFEFKYPDNLEINISDNANPNRSYYYLYVGFFPKGADETVGDFIAISADNEHESIDEYLTSVQCSDDKEGCTNPDQYTPFNLSGNPAKEITIDEGVYSAHRVISQKDGFIFVLNISLNRIHEDFYSKEEKEMLFNQILSTFRFLNEETTKLKVCPEIWAEQLNPPVSVKLTELLGSEQQDFPQQYLVVDGIPRKTEMYDLDWIKKNCKVNKPEPVG